MNWKALLGGLGMSALAPLTGGASLAALPGILGSTAGLAGLAAGAAPGLLQGTEHAKPGVTGGPGSIPTSVDAPQMGNTKGILSTIGPGLGKVFGKGGIDPTTALLGGLSLFGGQDRQSFKGTAVDPVKTMTDTLSKIDALSAKVASRGPSQLRSPLSPTGQPAPVTIPGIPFQIGGGLGSDPSIPADPSKSKLRTP